MLLPPSIVERLRQLRRRVLLPPAHLLFWAATGIKAKSVFDMELRVRDLEARLHELDQLRTGQDSLKMDHERLVKAARDRLDELRQHTPAVPPGPFLSDTVFVLGSGPSMLRMSAEERSYVQEQQTVAMNRYMVFWEKVGIWPKYWFLADAHPPAPTVLDLSVARILRSDRRPQIWLNADFQLHCPMTLDVCFFRWDPRREGIESWAGTCEDHLYFWRGSLSSLLNLLAIKRVGRKIKLLGVDLGQPGTFFEDELLKNPELLPADDVGRPIHQTAMPRDGKGGIQEKWPWMMERIRGAGMDLVCCNPRSLLVEQGLCAYEPIIPGRAGPAKTGGE